MKSPLSAVDIGIKATAAQPDTSAVSTEVTSWLKEMAAARKREKKFRTAGARIVSIYEAGETDHTPFNILYSNTETMMPALYNSTPTPVVQRRFKDEDAMGLATSRIGERVLKYLIDDGNAEYTSFDDLMKSAVLEALLPGRGVTRFKYDATFEKAEAIAEAEAVEGEDSEEVEGEALETEPAVETVQYETVCGEEVPWDRFLHGSAKKWKDVPWVAFEHFMTREELEESFGGIGAKVPVTEMVSNDQTQSTRDNDESDTNASAVGTDGTKVAQVFEIWDKVSRKILFVSPQWKEAPLKKVDDPLKLQGFYPCPRPLTFLMKVSTLTPVALYSLYETQAKELNIITTRINKITAALKVRGMYDTTVEGIDKVLKADDNTLVPVENVAALVAQGNALEKAIFLMPIEKLVTVLQQLYTQREQVKTIIYELTGVADIMRGSSAASETLGAQELKNQWGTLRLKKTQKEVMRYARDCLRIIAEIATAKLSLETVKSMTGLKYPTAEEKARAQQDAQQLQAQAQQMAMQAQQTGQPPAPPPPPPPGMQEALELPTWEELLGILKDDTQRNYRIDIETNSTVDAEATEDKKDIAELLNAISQFLNGVGPLVQDGTMPFDVAQGMLLAVVRRYRFGPELEDQLRKMKPPEKGGNPEELKKQQAELEKRGAEVEKQEKALEQRIAAETMKFQQAQADLKLAQQELDSNKKFAMREVEMNKEFAKRELELQSQISEAQLDVKRESSEQKLALKASMQGEDIRRKAQDIDKKGKEVAQREQQVDPKTIASAISEPLLQGLTMLAEKLSEGIVQAAKVQKTAKKQADGSWTTVTN